MSESVVLLHGFGGTGRAFDAVIGALPPERYRALPLDLPGHGSLAEQHAEPITFESCVESVLARSPQQRFALCGYSMGGRVALHLALAAPDRVARLVLVSTTAGIEDAAQRQVRIASDELLAQELEEGPYEEFVRRWRAQPLFADQSPQARRLAAQDNLRHGPAGLAASLRGLGAGRMLPLWGRLGELSMPAVVLAGERDGKYVAIARRLADSLPRAQLRIVEGGHGLLLDNPQAVAAAIADATGSAGSAGSRWAGTASA